jgi:linoleoyl-CoA desaturase
MKKIRFSCDNKQEKDFSTEVREKVNNYFKENNISPKGNYQLWFKTTVMLTLYLAPFFIILSLPINPWLALVLAVIMGVGEAGIGMSVMHDAAHGAYSQKSWVNKWMAGSMNLLGSNLFNWQVQHNYLHHTFTNIYGYDPDIETKAVIRLCRYAPLKKYHRFQYIYAFPFYGLMTLSKLFSDMGQLIKYEKEGIIKDKKASLGKEIVRLIFIKVFYFSIILGLPFIFTSYTWWQILIGFVTLHVVAGAIMGTVFQMAHVVEGALQPIPNKNNWIEHEWYVHQLSSTSDFARNTKLLSWYVGGLNFQIEHHLFTYMSHIHYPKIAPIVEETAKKYGIKYNLKPSFAAAFLSHVKRLKELGKDS